MLKTIAMTTLLLSIAIAGSAASSAFDKSMLIMSTDDGKTEKVNGVLRIDENQIEFDTKKGDTIFTADFEDVSKLIYERTKKPRYSAGLLLAWPLLFTKEKQHYITVQAEGKYAFIKVHKGRYRAVIAALESSSGMEVERLEE